MLHWLVSTGKLPGAMSTGEAASWTLIASRMEHSKIAVAGLRPRKNDQGERHKTNQESKAKSGRHWIGLVA